MANVSLNKLNTIKAIEPKIIKIGEEQVSVKQYLPMTSKSELVGKVIEETLDAKGIISPIRQKVYTTVFIIMYYTNINITDTMVTNIEKTYEILHLNKIDELVMNEIPQSELDELENLINNTLREISNYNLSFVGTLDNMQAFQKKDEKSVQEILSDLQTISSNETLTEVLNKLG